MPNQNQFRNDLRDALAHLHDPAYLESHPLARQLVGPDLPRSQSRGQALRALLKEAIETLRPSDHVPSHMPEWRSYRALYYRYIKGMGFLHLQEELGLSRRQLQREERKGIDAMAAILRQRRISDDATPGGEAPREPGETQPLLQHLEGWKVERRACPLQGLIEDVRWMLEPMVQRFRTEIEVFASPRVVQVLVDPTLTRQALLRVMRLLIRSLGQGKIELHVIDAGQMVKLVLSCPLPRLDHVDEDWRLAALLMGKQGGELRFEANSASESRITLELPRVSRARVLVVDDVDAAQTLFERYLTPHNYEVIGARSASEALRLAIDTKPDAIILDVMMATVDGWQALRDLRSRSSTAEIPVVVCSVLDEPELALSLGAQAFVRKPVRRLELLTTLEQVLGPRGREDER